MTPDTDQLARWLLGSLQLDTAVLHVGQYCGRWRASTAGRELGSFHLVLDGDCYLHLDGAPPVALGPRDGVFLLRDLPHFLSPHPDPLQAASAQAMRRSCSIRRPAWRGSIRTGCCWRAACRPRAARSSSG